VDAQREQLARKTLVEIGFDDRWLEVADADSPEWLLERARATVEAYQSGDLDWVLEQSDPEIVITQPREFPDPRTYRGHEGLVEAILDWPEQWESFELEPKRIFAANESQFVIVAIHRGRSRQMGIDVEAEIVWLFTLRDGRTLRWEMFMSLEQALEATEAA
jgi:ketosteroid isomerase-like protein